MKKLLIIALVNILISASCKKNKVEELNPIVSLRDKTLSEIKAEVQGNWKIHYRYVGFTGNIKTPLNNSFFKVLVNDSIYLKFENVSFAEDKATFTKLNTMA